eukprot:TRINITY_DN17714_c0_g1_i1.p1 TRINITY_DN17714_c0_g1~~TRINITY_DN17714_c0_g1_i1.p1  ORF type:complete len:974 (-),score=159.96 TRINITY_DN17714_c0_g1_i1:41-2635(-)
MEETCEFLREETKKVASNVEHVTTVSVGFFKGSVTDKVVTTVTEYFWKFDALYELFLYEGTNLEKKIVLQGRKGSIEVMTSSKVTPRPSATNDQWDVDLTWLFGSVASPNDLNFQFGIDRKAKDCKTPRRNRDIEKALMSLNGFSSWCSTVRSYYDRLFSIHSDHGYDLAKLNSDEIFVPIAPLFDETKGKHSEKSKAKSTQLVSLEKKDINSVNLAISDINLFLEEQKRTIAAKFEDLSKMFPDDGKIITLKESQNVVLLRHGNHLVTTYNDGIEYIEDMLYKQLISAIGKTLTPVDFTNYMRYHNRLLFKDEYMPGPFSSAVRRPDHYPEGLVSIEACLSDGSIPEPLYTMKSSRTAQKAMNFPINASTSVSFYGERHLHSWVMNQFNDESGVSLNLVARARQFSSFIMLVGSIASEDTFEPKCGIIIQNKDELSIPLMLEQIPTPKEFRDAIESLSPEQQRFCKAYRSMQLASTLFGVVIIQIKPQLEKLLKLPDDSLTKEIKLTQDLLELFMKYHIPSDLLSYGDDPNAPPSTKLERVQRHVEKMQILIKNTKIEKLAEVKQAVQFVQATLPPPPREPEPVYDDLVLSIDYDMPKSSRAKGKVAGGKKKSKKMASPKRDKAPGGGGPAIQRSLAASPVAAKIAAPSPSPLPPPSPSPSPVPAPATPTPSIQSPSPVPPPSDTITIPDKELSIPTVPPLDSDIDYTRIPPILDEKFEALDEDSALRPTIISIGQTWNKKTKKSLLSPITQLVLNTNEQIEEKNAAFDLLDALSRSGTLPIDHAELHVVIGATHCFAKSLIDTVIQENVNPVEKVERSLLIMATTIHNCGAVDLVRPDQLEKVSTYSPQLFPKEEESVKLLK